MFDVSDRGKMRQAEGPLPMKSSENKIKAQMQKRDVFREPKPEFIFAYATALGAISIHGLGYLLGFSCFPWRLKKELS